MGSKGSSTGSTTTIQQADPWVGQQPYLTDLFSKAQQSFNNGDFNPGYYPGQAIAPQSTITQEAIQAQIDRARNGSPLMGSAQQAVGGMINGNNLYSNPAMGLLSYSANGGPANQIAMNQLNDMAQGGTNPYLDATFQKASGQTRSALDSQFARAGRYGSGAHESAAGDAQNNLANQIYGGAYENDANRRLQAANSLGSQQIAGRAQQLGAVGQMGSLYDAERARQMQALGMAPSLAQADYADISALGQAGNNLDAYLQNLINSNMQRFNSNNLSASDALSKYASLIGGQNWGSNSTSTQSGTAAPKNAAAGALSGAIGGATLGSAFGPWGAGIGAIGGGLLGMF